MRSKIIFIGLFILAKVGISQNVTASLSIPTSANPGTDMLVEVTVNKGTSNGFMKYYQELPEGFTAVDVDSKTGSFSYADNGVKIVWITPPSDASFVISYKVNVPASATGSKAFAGKLSYIEANERMAFEIPATNVSFGGAAVAAAPKPVAVPPTPAPTQVKETPKPEVVKETPKAETPKPEPVKETPKPEVVKETPKAEVPKPEPVKESPKPEPVIAKVDPPKKEIVATPTPAPTPAPKTVTIAPTPKAPTAAAPTSSAGKTYRVQIGAYNLNPVISNVLEISKVTLDNGITKYFSGNFSTYDEATKRKTEVIAKGFPGAFIVQFVDGKMVK